MSEAGDTHLNAARPDTGGQQSLLFVVNYPANTGYAWDNIERSLARVSDRLAERGVRTFVAFPSIEEPPRTLSGSAAEAVELDATLGDVGSLRATIEFVRKNHVRVLYLTDRPAFSWKYAVLRRATSCAVVVHDRTSGGRTAPRGMKRAVKRAIVRTPGFMADVVVAVSNYVRDRQIEVGLVPAERVVRVYNGFRVDTASESVSSTYAEFGIDTARPIVAGASRASREKGIETLLRAFDRVADDPAWNERRPVLIYLGDGPHMPELRKLRSSLAAGEDILLPGYRPGAVGLLSEAAVFVVPSLWHDAFPSAVLEPMARGKPVIATEVGGIPEMVEPGVSGILVPPGEVEPLADAIRELLHDPGRAEQMGRRAQSRIRDRFTPERQVDALVELFEARTGLLHAVSGDVPSG